MPIKAFIALLILTTCMYAHKVAGVDMSLERVGDNQIQIKAFFQKSQRPLFGNEVRLISMFDNRVLQKAKLLREGVVLPIPNESYWVYVIVRDNDIVQDGLAPIGGFQKALKLDKIAFNYSAIATLGCIIIACAIGIYRRRSFQQSLT